MIRAMWRGVVVAESDKTVLIEGNHYFPREAVRWEHLKPNSRTTVCGWKGTANYYDIEVGGEVNRGAVWCYANPKPAAEAIRGRIAFWRGVDVISVADDARPSQLSGVGKNTSPR
jgi:uncharacterized protein (DUF427 family)